MAKETVDGVREMCEVVGRLGLMLDIEEVGRGCGTIPGKATELVGSVVTGVENGEDGVR